jgi:hypothetical protein
VAFDLNIIFDPSRQFQRRLTAALRGYSVFRLRSLNRNTFGRARGARPCGVPSRDGLCSSLRSSIA